MKNREMHTRLIQSVADKDYTTAIEITKSEDFYAEERSKLLRLLERGSTYYYAKMYYLALQEFDKAKELSDMLFTKSISAAIAGTIDYNQTEFYGERYERSQIRFFQSLIHYALANTGIYESWTDENNIVHPEKILTSTEKNFHINAAKSVLREWHSIFNEYKIETEGKATYKADLMEHLLGAAIYEQSTSAADWQIARTLYQQAKEILLKNYNIYPAFNKKNELFSSNYAQLSTMTNQEISIYIDPTDFARNLNSYIDLKLSNLGKSRNNVIIILKDGYVANKTATEHKLVFNVNDLITLSYLNDHISVATSGENIDKSLFYAFAVTYLLSNITYDLPHIEQNQVNNIEISVTNIDGISTDIPIVLTAPISDIAFNEINDKIDKEKTVLITRLTGEYIGAAATAYLTYLGIKDDDNPWSGVIATSAAVVLFKSLGAAINSHNRADTRQWKLLPSNVRLGTTTLKEGAYVLNVFQNNNGNREIIETRNIVIEANTTFLDINI